MTTKSKKRYESIDKRDNKKFLTTVSVVVLVVMILMYLVYTRM